MTPPTTPPAIGPLSEWDFLGVDVEEEVEVAVGIATPVDSGVSPIAAASAGSNVPFIVILR